MRAASVRAAGVIDRWPRGQMGHSVLRLADAGGLSVCGGRSVGSRLSGMRAVSAPALRPRTRTPSDGAVMMTAPLNCVQAAGVLAVD